MQKLYAYFSRFYWVVFIFALFFTFGLMFPYSSKNSNAAIDPGSGGGNSIYGTAPSSGVPIPPDVPDDVDLEQCAYDLTNYMNTVLENLESHGDLQHAKLLSPAFNLTSRFEQPLFEMMIAYEADFDKLDYFSGNSYTLRQGGITHALAPYNSFWKPKFSEIGVNKFIFTEFGDFSGDPAHDKVEGHIVGEKLGETLLRNTDVVGFIPVLGDALSDGSIEGILYFNPYGLNTADGFKKHVMSSEEFSELTLRSNKVGANTAGEIDYNGGQVQKALSYGGGRLGWILEITMGPNPKLIEYIKNLPTGVKPVIRLCWGSTCEFRDPLTLADYIITLDAAVDKDFYIIVGPNEPLTDPWLSPACGSVDDRDYEWKYVPCDAGPETLLDPEFHSLRPYPAAPCPHDVDLEPENPVFMCGNDLAAKQKFTYTVNNVDKNTYCPNPQIVDEAVSYLDIYGNIVNSTVRLISYFCPNIPQIGDAAVTIKFNESELPVVGNTEDVPNGDSAFNGLSFEQRVNNYLSWYLNGVIPRAEEDFVAGTSPYGISKILNFAGPIQKLAPWDVLNKDFGNDIYEFWYERGILTPFSVEKQVKSVRSEKARVVEVMRRFYHGQCLLNPFDCSTNWAPVLEVNDGDNRHNQIVVCGGGFPEACYTSSSQERTRRNELNNPLSLKYPYIPMSTTEDIASNIWVKNVVGLTNDQGGSNSTGFPTDDGFGTNPVLEEEILDSRTAPKYFDYLFYPHVREVVQLSRLLQATYIPRGVPGNSTSGMPPLKEIEYDDTGGYCTIVGEYKYTNPGDNLYGDKGFDDYSCSTNPTEYCDDKLALETREIRANIDFKTTFKCDFIPDFNEPGYVECMSPDELTSCKTPDECRGLNGQENPGYWQICDRWYGTPDSTGLVSCTYLDRNSAGNSASCLQDNLTYDTCNRSTVLTLDVETENPYIREIFNRLVYGNMSFFRRIYPRLYANNKSLPEPLSQIKVPGPEEYMENIVGFTNVQYTSIDGKSEVVAGDPSKNVPGNKAEIYFPYLGSLHQYFLQDVQCALRPADIGCDNTSIVLDDTEVPAACLAITSLPPTLPAIKTECKWNNSCSTFRIGPPSLQKIFESAGSRFNVPAGVLAGVFYNEGGYDRFEWTDELVYASSGESCGVPSCDSSNISSTGAKGPWQFVPYTWGLFKDAVIEAGVRPADYEPNICNIIDSTFAAAKKLGSESGGDSSYPNGNKCANTTLLNSVVAATTCRWDASRIVTASVQYVGGCWASNDPSIPAYNESVLRVYQCRSPYGPRNSTKIF